MNSDLKLSSAAGHLLIAGALGLLLLAILPVAAAPLGRTVTFVAVALFDR